MFKLIKTFIKTYKLIKILTAEIIRLETEYPNLTTVESKKNNLTKQQGVKGMFFKITGKKWKFENRFLRRSKFNPLYNKHKKT